MSNVPERWRRPIFVVSMGRSGSTLLQRLLNVHPEITIWGEHGGFLTGLLKSYEVASHPDAVRNLTAGYERRQMAVGALSDVESFIPWVSPFLPEQLGDRIRELMLDLFTGPITPDIRWGFKEIRYGDEEVRSLMSMFPDAHLVLLARDIEGFARSRFFAFGNTDFDLDSPEGRAATTKRLENLMKAWIRRYTGLVQVREELGERCSLVTYDQLSVGSDRPMELFAELGEALPSVDAVNAVLGTVAGSSYKHNSAARASRERIGEFFAEANVDREEIARLSSALGIS